MSAAAKPRHRKNPGVVGYRRVEFDGRVIRGQETFDGTEWFEFAALPSLFAISLAMRFPGMTEKIMAVADGFGAPGLFPSGYDWSGIRDSSPAAVSAMVKIALPAIADHFEELEELGLPGDLLEELLAQENPRRPNASYRHDPRWIQLKYPSKCAARGCGKVLPRGSRAFYYPTTRQCFGEACRHGAAAERDFLEHKFDEERNPRRGAAAGPRRKRNLFGFGGGRKVVTIDEVRELQKETADSQCRHGEYRAAQRTVKQSPRAFARARGMRLEGGLDRVKRRVKLHGARKLESLAAKLRGNPEHPEGDLVPYNVAEDFDAPVNPDQWYRLTVPALEALQNALEDEHFYRRETVEAPEGRYRRDLLALSQAIEEAKAFGARVFVSHDPGGWYFAKERAENPSGIEFVIGRPKGETTTAVQSVLFDARRWTVERAKRWLRDNGFASPAVDRGGARAHELRFRQRPPEEFQAGSFRTIPAGRHRRGRRNPEDEAREAAELFETFQGRAPEEILELHRQQVERRDYAKLGDLVSLTVLAPNGEECKFEFAGDDVIVASSANAHQLYLLGGNQDVRPLLGEMGVDATKDFVELGPCLEIEYFTHKALDNFEPVRYYHRFGEETKEVPVLAFDQLNLQLILVGGAYEVKAEGIVN